MPLDSGEFCENRRSREGRTDSTAVNKINFVFRTFHDASSYQSRSSWRLCCTVTSRCDAAQPSSLSTALLIKGWTYSFVQVSVSKCKLNNMLSTCCETSWCFDSKERLGNGIVVHHGVLHVGLLVSLSPTRKETSYSDQTRDLFNTLPTKLNTFLNPLL